ncbi:MAG: hypothetical protein COA82_09785 [Alkaliphilus sp.]|nr:MAG: hypothetical protein COA82_09785 [Alkaliphilus sp.]
MRGTQTGTQTGTYASRGVPLLLKLKQINFKKNKKKIVDKYFTKMIYFNSVQQEDYSIIV